MTLVTDIPTALLAANSGGIALLVAIQAGAAIAVYVHASRDGNRFAVLWGLATLIIIATVVIYAARVWWNRGGKHHYTPR